METTLSEFRKRERREAEQAARAAAEAKRQEDLEAAKQRANDAKVAALKAQYRTYWLHQIKTSIEESKIATLARWCELSANTRQTILDIIQKDPTVRIAGL